MTKRKGDIVLPQPTKLVGVSFENEDGANRQRLVKKLRKGQELGLVYSRKWGNYYAVDRSGQKIGWLMEYRGDQVGTLERQGHQLFLRVLNVTGRKHGNLGVNVEIDSRSRNPHSLFVRVVTTVGCLSSMLCLFALFVFLALLIL